MTTQNFRFDVDADGVALITWDMPGRSMNVLTPEVIEELDALVDKVAAEAAIKGAVVTSGKEGFSGGADLAMLQGMSGEYARLAKAEGEEAAMRFFFDRSRQLSLIYRKLETCGKPFAAAINGVCMGGAFELALSCHYRIVADRRQGARRPARDQGRPVSRRRRHAARRAADGDPRRLANAVQGRTAPARGGQANGPRPRRGAAERNRRARQGVGEGQPERQGAVGRPEIQAARRAGSSRPPA